MIRALARTPITFGVLALVAGAYLWPELGALLAQDPDAIRAGEIWRLLTGSLVHTSGRHLLLDAVTLGIAGVLIERRGDPYPLALCVVAATAIGVGIHVLQPDSVRFGGLSSVAFAAIVYVSLQALADPGPCRRAGAAVLGCVVLKLTLDLRGAAVLYGVEGDGIVPPAFSHVMGTLVALGTRVCVVMRSSVRVRGLRAGLRHDVRDQRQTLGRLEGRRRAGMGQIALER